MSERYPDAPGHRGVDTSIAAAEAIEPVSAYLQRVALRAIRATGKRGLTAEELAATIRCTRETIQPRTTELRRCGLILDSGARRFNGSGKRAIVWVAAPRKEASA